jgi:hypothetical protein
MRFDTIKLNRSPWQILSPAEAVKYVNDYVSNSRRFEPLWDSAISEINNAVADRAWNEKARTALFAALQSNGIVD